MGKTPKVCGVCKITYLDSALSASSDKLRTGEKLTEQQNWGLRVLKVPSSKPAPDRRHRLERLGPEGTETWHHPLPVPGWAKKVLAPNCQYAKVCLVEVKHRRHKAPEGLEGFRTRPRLLGRVRVRSPCTSGQVPNGLKALGVSKHCFKPFLKDVSNRRFFL